MNLQAINQTIDHLKTEPLGFNMDSIHHCIGGQIRKIARISELDAAYVIAEYFKCSIDIADKLAYPRTTYPSPYDATALQAAKVLEHLRDTGEVDWTKAFQTQDKGQA